MTRVVLVDDHELFREGLRALLQGEQVSVVGTAGDAREAIRLLDDSACDLVIVDVTLPGPSGVSLLRDLKRAQPHRPVLMLTMHTHADVVADAFDNGADGYALKSQSPAELLEAIHAVVAGERYLAPTLRTATSDGGGDSSTPSGLLRMLTRREREIFELLVRGENNRAIGRLLFISVKTVETHRTRLMRKLEVHSIAELVRLAARHGHLAAWATNVA
ncbi:MAG TPA: response regulator transcription factor [Polyangia bacterium]|nr:response regulator transcription factor [Polyangia bacterium]